ncbi:MAG TPA: peptidoglycan DD-metalloendopeptidase family protein [Actinomycetota bacterium]|nr:peptidoglycan DD-metalloendopeptidase family protein [Actinomycetota bacterium]
MFGPLVMVGTASAQPAPTPAPNPLESLLPNLLAPLAPLLNPSPKPTAPAGGAPAQSKPTVGTAGATQPQPPIPTQVEVNCGPVPRPLVFARTAPRTTQPLLDAAAKVTPPGGTVQATMMRVAAPFPLAGSASYRDDWGEPRTTPCPHLHQGNDIFANFGTPYVAPEGGVVASYGFESVGGNSVYFMGDDGYGLYGAHLQGFAPGLKIGAHVDAGTLLGFVGNTGDAAGGSPHLHFQLYPPGHAWGSPVDPKSWLDNMLNTAIAHAGGVVPVEGLEGPLPQATPGVNVGGLMNSVLLAGGHIISQPTVPVVLFVLLVLGALLIAQTRTFKVAAELRRSRSQAAVPAFLVGGTSGLVRPVAPSRRDRRKAAEATAALVDDRPVWARSLPAVPAEPAEKKPGWPRRLLRALGDTWGRLPERLSRVSSPAPKTVAFTPSANGHAMNGNGHAPAMNGSKNGSKNKASKVRGAPADAPYSLAGSRFAKK